MKENKLAEMSMDFAVDIINLVKHLKSQHETVISNQIGRSGTSIGAIYTKLIMRKAKRTSFLNLKLPSKKQVKRDIGSSFYIEQII